MPKDMKKLNEDEDERAEDGPEAVGAMADGFAESDEFPEGEDGDGRGGKGDDGGSGEEHDGNDKGDKNEGGEDTSAGHGEEG